MQITMFDSLLTWIREIFAVMQSSHDSFWNGNYTILIIYIVSLVILFKSKGKNKKAKSLFAAFSITAILAFCYNPFFHTAFIKLPYSGEAVFSRVWMFLPVWTVIAFTGAELISTFKSIIIQHGSYLLLAAVIVLSGTSLNAQEYYINSTSSYKANLEGVEIADAILAKSNDDPVGVLFISREQADIGNYTVGGTAYYAISQYTGKIETYPIFCDEITWNGNYLSEVMSDGETKTEDYLNSYFNLYFRRYYDFSYVVMPHDDSLMEKMQYSGYQYISSTDNYDVYVAMQRWWVQSFSYIMENGKKVYVLSDNMGHFIVVGGGSKYDRRQLQSILSVCGYHVDLWIMTSPSSDNLEGFNYLASMKDYSIDRVCIPAMDIDNVPEGFMDKNDYSAYEEFLGLSEAGCFELDFVSDGDEFEMYGMNFQILSDMLNIQSGTVTDNSMLFRMEAGSKSFLFCSYIGYDQGQVALQKYGDTLDSDYVQIASGTGDGLGTDFYDVVSPDIAFCDSIRDDAGYETYNQLISSGVTCYCLGNGAPNTVMLE